MNRPAAASHRDELLARCRRERNELIATTARTLALLPRARSLAHLVRAMSRLLRVIAASRK